MGVTSPDPNWLVNPSYLLIYVTATHGHLASPGYADAEREALAVTHDLSLAGSNLRRWPTRMLGRRPDAADLQTHDLLFFRYRATSLAVHNSRACGGRS